MAIADDQAMVRAGFRMIVQSQTDLQVVGEAADGQEAIELVRRERPDVMLMDIRMPRLERHPRNARGRGHDESRDPDDFRARRVRLRCASRGGVGVSAQGGAA